jgi:transcriptional antiterminator
MMMMEIAFIAMIIIGSIARESVRSVEKIAIGVLMIHRVLNVMTMLAYQVMEIVK